MGKKNKHKDPESKGPSILEGLDSTIDEQYKEIVTEVEDIQYEIYLADKKKYQKQRRKMKKKGRGSFYAPHSAKARKAACKRITADKIFNGIKKIFEELKPLWLLLARVVRLIICAILSMDIVKRKISKQTLDKLQSLYNFCLAV